ncbi:MAG: D-amino-acid transaminase [Geminicoccaceae bacterium]|nr:D-amino-acid transaminase [Geminicoccaceae bacterium]
MARIAYVNGRYQPIHRPAVPVEDRGYQFADGVYEVMKVVGGEPRDLDRHMRRLRRSLDGLGIRMPMSPPALEAVIRETLRRNRLKEAVVYLQVSRGAAPRNHLYAATLKPSLVVTVRRAGLPSAKEWAEGVAVVSLPDERWARRDIKSISLLPNSLARQKAKDRGAREAFLVDGDGCVTEASASNAWIVDRNGTLVTHPLGHGILGGITRERVLEEARAAGIPVEERRFTLDEAKAAREAFLTSTSSFVLPVVRIDDAPIGNGHPGETTRRLQGLYAEAAGLHPRFHQGT